MPAPYPESAHPYAPSIDQTQSYTLPGVPARIWVTFSPLCSTTAFTDYIFLYDGTGNPVGVSNGYSGTMLAGLTIGVLGDTIQVRLVTDVWGVDYGYDVTLVADTPGVGALGWVDAWAVGDQDLFWECVASDADGSHLIAGLMDGGGLGPPVGRLYTSADFGATWVERQPAGNVNLDWHVVASDADGSHLIAGVQGGRLYTSADFGVTWTERTPAGAFDVSWAGAASDDTGANIVVAVFVGRIYTSTDGGVSWTERNPWGGVAANRSWTGVASDSDGSNLVVGGAGVGGRLWTSGDFGVTWTERTPGGAVNLHWDGVASDADGSNLIVASSVSPSDLIPTFAGRIWTSADSGAIWTERQPYGNMDVYWGKVASNSDGSKLLVGVKYLASAFPPLFAASLWQSQDSGATWVEQRPIVNYMAPPFFPGGTVISGVASDTTGDRVMACILEPPAFVPPARLFVAFALAAPPPPPAIAPDPHLNRLGKPYIKCANVWDWCLENDGRLWRGVDWSRYGCMPVKCWRLEDNPLHAIPEQGREFHKFGMIPLPLTFGVDTQILRFQVPTGYSGVVYGVLCKYTGGGYVNGSGDLLWRFQVNQRWIKSLQAVPTELGDYSGYAQLDEYFKLSSGQTVRAYGWVDPATGLVGGSMIAALQGWYFPSQFAR